MTLAWAGLVLMGGCCALLCWLWHAAEAEARFWKAVARRRRREWVENDERLRGIIRSLSDRVAAQSALLTRRSCREEAP